MKFVTYGSFTYIHCLKVHIKKIYFLWISEVTSVIISHPLLRSKNILFFRYHLAEMNYQKALSINSKSSVILCHIGVVQHHLKETEKALSTFNTAIANNPKSPLCKFHRGSIYFALGRHAEALKELEELKEIVPKESLVYYLIGECLQFSFFLISFLTFLRYTIYRYTNCISIQLYMIKKKSSGVILGVLLMTTFVYPTDYANFSNVFFYRLENSIYQPFLATQSLTGFQNFIWVHFNLLLKAFSMPKKFYWRIFLRTAKRINEWS